MTTQLEGGELCTGGWNLIRPRPENQGDNVVETDPAEQSTEERLANARMWRKKISVLSDVAKKMVDQCECEAEVTQQCHDDFMREWRLRHEGERNQDEEERRRHDIMVEDREAFREAIDRSVAVIESATAAFLRMGEMFFLRKTVGPDQVAAISSGAQRPVPAQDAMHPSPASAQLTSQQVHGKIRKRMVKKVKRMDL